MKKIKFALKMKDGVEARTLEELQEAFDLGLAMGYLADGRLERWLEDRHYEEEVEKIAGLDKEAPDLGKRLCAILQVPYTEEMEMGLEEESDDWCPITRSIFKELAPLGMDAVIAKLLEDDRALQELAVGFSASVSGRGPGSVQQIDGEGARLVLDGIESVLTDASSTGAKFQEHVFQWMRSNLDGVSRNPSKYLMNELCRRMAMMVRDSLSELVKKGDEPTTNVDPIDVSSVDAMCRDMYLDMYGESMLQNILQQLQRSKYFDNLPGYKDITLGDRLDHWNTCGQPELLGVVPV